MSKKKKYLLLSATFFLIVTVLLDLICQPKNDVANILRTVALSASIVLTLISNLVKSNQTESTKVSEKNDKVLIGVSIVISIVLLLLVIIALVQAF